MRCHSHVEHKYVECESLSELGEEQTKLSAEGYDTSVETEGDGDDEVLKPRRYVISADRHICRCVCQSCGHVNGTETKKRRSK